MRTSIAALLLLLTPYSSSAQDVDVCVTPSEYSELARIETLKIRCPLGIATGSDTLRAVLQEDSLRRVYFLHESVLLEEVFEDGKKIREVRYRANEEGILISVDVRKNLEGMTVDINYEIDKGYISKKVTLFGPDDPDGSRTQKRCVSRQDVRLMYEAFRKGLITLLQEN